MNEQEFLINIKEQLEYLVNHGKHLNVLFVANVDDGEDERSEPVSVLFGKFAWAALALVDVFKEKPLFMQCAEYALAQLPSRTSNVIRFTANELDVIRDALAEPLARFYEGREELAGIESSSYDDYLPIINKIQAHFLCPEFKDVKQFVNNTSGKWTEIEEGGES